MINQYFCAILLFSTILNAQNFGQNKVQYRDFEWNFIQTPHFDIYYYGGQKELAEFAAEIAEESYEQISIHLRWTLKNRVSIMVYNSHNEFQQTNVVGTYMREGVGGVTELFKNRVVFPFEGNYEQFRHVIHHELVHAVINDMVYGGRMQNVVSSRARIRVPLWANEGLAEYLSSNWDTKADMIMRDIAVHERIPSVNELNYFMAYKGGQSVWRYISSKYGREKIGDVFRAMKRTQNAQRGFELSLGMNYKDLTKQWHKYLKKEYWPDIKDRDPVEDISEKLTDHKKSRNFYNVSPALSPDGTMVATLSDQNGYFDIIILDAMTGKKIKRLVKGNRSVDFEELKWLQPGLSWSPDNKKIVVAAKAGKSDALHIINVKTRKSKKYSIALDGVFSAIWSPNGRDIAFVGQSGKSSDLYLFNIKNESIKKITDDVFSDSYPSWNRDGTKIAFVSDRGQFTSGKYDGFMYDHNFSQTDIYVIDLSSGLISRVTNTEHNESDPIWANTKDLILYTSDYNGVWNLFVHSLDKSNTDENAMQVPYAITNVLTGLQQPTISRDDATLILAGYSGIGWDLYSLSKPLDLKKKVIAPTQFISTTEQGSESITDLRRHKSGLVFDRQEINSYSRWIFARGYENYNNSNYDNDKENPALSVDSTKLNGEYISRAYKTRFTLDIVSGNLQISNVFGASGMTYFSFSDILGDHQIAFGTEMVLTLENSDYFFQYGYLKNKLDYYFVGFQNVNFFPAGFSALGRLRHYGIQTFVSAPFSRFQRLDYGFSWHNINYSILTEVIDEWGNYQYIEVPGSSTNFSRILPRMSWVFDNSIFGITGPVDGFRKNTTMTISPELENNSTIKYNFLTFKSDLRKYWRVGKDYTVAFRSFFGKSSGPGKQNFFLGGIPYLIGGKGETNGSNDNGNFREVILDASNTSLINDIYFTEYAWPLRGARFGERFGYSTSLFNIEVRFPFINYLALGFPLKMIFGNIRGHAFMDIGAAWHDFSEFQDDEWPKRYWLEDFNGNLIPPTTVNYSPWVVTNGIGTKINLGYFLLKIEAAWDRNPNGYSKPQWYFSLGPDW